MGMPEDFFAMFEDAIEDAYQKGELPRELMYAHEASKVMKTCHGDLCILKDMLEGFNPEVIPTTNDVILFKNMLATITMQACLLSDSAEGLKKKYPDILGQEGGDK
jgi:hypothetical protein